MSRTAILGVMALIALTGCGIATYEGSPGNGSLEDICKGISNVQEHVECLDRVIAASSQFGASQAARAGEVRKEFLPAFWVFSFGWWIAYYGFGIVIGLFVYRDARTRKWLVLGIKPMWWGLIPVFEPALGILAYWAMHYSTLARTFEEANGSVAPSGDS